MSLAHYRIAAGALTNYAYDMMEILLAEVRRRFGPNRPHSRLKIINIIILKFWL